MDFHKKTNDDINGEIKSPEVVSHKQRDQRVDLIRGAALLMIFIDHTSGNIFSQITLLGIQHTDAAHLFVFLSGFSCMAAYGKTIVSENLFVGFKKILDRCLKLYLTQIALILSAIFLVALVRYFSPALFNPDNMSQGISDSALFEYSMDIIPPVVLMLQAPDYFDLLRLYIVMMLAFPAIAWGIKRAPLITISISIALWLFTRRPIGLHIDDYPLDRPWLFNPFAWQLLFVLGAYLRNYIVEIGDLPNYRVLKFLSWTIVLMAFVYTVGQDIPMIKNIMPQLKIWRTNLQPIQLLNTLALLYVIFTTKFFVKAAQTFFGRVIVVCGRHSLMIYSIGIILSLMVDICFMAYGNSPLVQIPATMFGCLVLISIALSQEKRKLRSRQAAA